MTRILGREGRNPADLRAKICSIRYILRDVGEEKIVAKRGL
jgi:hypothetical protein